MRYLLRGFERCCADADAREVRMRAFSQKITDRLKDLRGRQDGVVLLEVIFSTLVVAMTTAAVLKGVEGSLNTTVLNRERSVSAQLAEQDQERMRSYKATSLDGYSQTRTVAVRGINYTVASSTQWIFDSSGTKSCTSSTSQASYLKLMSTVTPLKGKPVTATSLLTPPNGTYSNDKGSLAVMVTDRTGAPRPNLTVNLTGNSVSQSDTTNSSGCANFYYLPVGNYTVTVAASGLVDRSGSASPTVTAGVVGGQSTLTTVELDVPVTFNVSFDTKQGTNAAVAARAQYVRLASSGLASPGFLAQNLATFPTTNNTFSYTSLYPFTSGYAYYGGDGGGCDKNNPIVWVPSYTANTQAVTPGATYNVTARLPAIWIKVQNAGVNIANADVKITPTDTNCVSNTYPMQLTTATTATPPAALPNPGFPWGNYTVCADNSISVGTTNARKVTVAVANTNAAGTGTPVGAPTTAVLLNVLSTSTAGNC
jgi:Tfp pilus assembly protein PilV